MNAADSLLDVALASLQDVAGETVIYSGMTVSAVVSSTALKDIWENGGHIVHRGANIAIRGADLNGAVPSVGELIVSKGQTYQIEAVNFAAEGYELTCAEATV